MSFANVDEALGPIAPASASDPRDHGGEAAMIAGIGCLVACASEPRAYVMLAGARKTMPWAMQTNAPSVRKSIDSQRWVSL